MDGSTGLISVNSSCSEALLHVLRSLEDAGLRALETFDLQVARSSGASCACPRHGTADCDCQLIVLVVYGEGTAPTTLMLHGSDGRTWISLPDEWQDGLARLIEAAIAQTTGDARAEEGL